jgi:hypothetical protein
MRASTRRLSKPRSRIQTGERLPGLLTDPMLPCKLAGGRIKVHSTGRNVIRADQVDRVVRQQTPRDPRVLSENKLGRAETATVKTPIFAGNHFAQKEIRLLPGLGIDRLGCLRQSFLH